MGGAPEAEKQCLASRPVEVNERHSVLQFVHKQGHALLRFVSLRWRSRITFVLAFCPLSQSCFVKMSCTGEAVALERAIFRAEILH